MPFQSENQSEKEVTISEKIYLSLISYKLKGRVLFPEQDAAAKAHLAEIDQEQFIGMIRNDISRNIRRI